MSSEGVGSYWPFVSGLRMVQVNARWISFTPSVACVTSSARTSTSAPGKLVSTRSGLRARYLARRGSSRFQPNQIRPARCSLLGYAMHQIQVEGPILHAGSCRSIPSPKSARPLITRVQNILTFFHACLKEYLVAPFFPWGARLSIAVSMAALLRIMKKLFRGTDMSQGMGETT